MLTKTNIRKSVEEKRADWALYMLEWGRKHGAVPVKGIAIICVRCGAPTEKQHRSHDWCRACVKPAQLERRRHKRAAKGAETVGTTKACKECGASFQKEHARQFYCSPCNILSARDYLPSQRARVIKYQSTRNAERRKVDPAYAISCRISAGINSSLKGRKAGRKWEALVGYTTADLMKHLERQFVRGMSWGNRDLWDIDHITPLAAHSFETTDCADFKAAWQLSNLRPLWKTDNIRKSARRTHLL